MEIFKLTDEIPEKTHRSSTSSQSEPNEANGHFVITNLKQGVKNPNRVNVYLDGQYVFSLDMTQVVDYKLKVGKEITAEELVELQKASDFGKLYQRALEWVLMRPRSVRETKDYLLRKLRNASRGPGATNEERRCETSLIKTVEHERVREEHSEFSEKIIRQFIEKGYLDDYKFAEWYVENRFVKKGVSQKRLRMELAKKGIDKNTIEEVLGGRDDEEEIRKMIRRKRAKYDDEKLIAYLCRQGFSYDLVREMIAKNND